MSIRDGKLYRAEHETFEAYCRKKWQYGKSHAYRLIGAAEVVGELSPIGDILKPTNESQVRPLIGLAADQALLAWRTAVERAKGKPVTARLLAKAISELSGASAAKSPRDSGKTQKREVGDASLQ